MTVAVAGATGALGSAICHELLTRGVEVRALARTPDSRAAEQLRAAGANVVRADLADGSGLAAALRGAACVVSTATCFPRSDEIAAVDRDGNVELVRSAESAGVGRFVFVSFRPVPLDFPLQRAKRAVEATLAAAALEEVVLRPGKFMDVWFSPICGFDVAARRATVFGGGTAPVSWIAAADVAQVAARSTLGEGPTGVVELGGPEALSQLEVVAVYEDVLDASWRTETLPVGELERMLVDGADDVERSLGALMLETHLGSTTDPSWCLDAFPMRLTSVREFAEAYSPSG